MVEKELRLMWYYCNEEREFIINPVKKYQKLIQNEKMSP